MSQRCEPCEGLGFDTDWDEYALKEVVYDCHECTCTGAICIINGATVPAHGPPENPVPWWESLTEEELKAWSQEQLREEKTNESPGVPDL